MSALPLQNADYFTETEFFNWCKDNPTDKFELVNGEIKAMASASRNHIKITSNFTREMGNHLKDTECFVYPSDFYVRVSSQFHTYRLPDVVVDCGDDNKMANQPILIIEVTSKSTHQEDFNDKLMEYMTIPSLREYAIVEQAQKMVYVFRKSQNWQAQSYHSGEIYFKSIDYLMPIEEIYRQVIFENKLRNK